MCAATRTLARTAAPHSDYRRWRLIGLVGVGGALGTGLRLGVSALFPADSPLPVAVIAVNLSGALALGWLLETLALRGPETKVGRAIRLGVGTGVLGGYTTYSALAVGSDGLIAADSLAVGLLVAVPTVVAGVALAWIGTVVAVAISRMGHRQ